MKRAWGLLFIALTFIFGQFSAARGEKGSDTPKSIGILIGTPDLSVTSLARKGKEASVFVNEQLL